MTLLRALLLVPVLPGSQELHVRLLLVHQHHVKMVEPVPSTDLDMFVLVRPGFQALTAR